MSYILEALKRAEKERKLGQTPAALEEIALPQVGAEQSRRRWVLIGAGAVLIFAAFVYGAVALFHGRSAAAPGPTAGQASATTAPVETGVAPTTAAEIEAVQPTAGDATTAPPASEAPAAAADAKIEGGEAIASLDDLTGDGPSGAATSDAETTAENDSGHDDATQAAAVDASSPVKTVRAAPTPSPKPLPETPSKSAPPSPSASSAAAAAKTPISKPEARPAAPVPKQRTATISPSQVPIAQGLRAPLSGPLVVLGDQPQVIEPVDVRHASAAKTDEAVSTAAPRDAVTSQAHAETSSAASDPASSASAAKPATSTERGGKPARTTAKPPATATTDTLPAARDRADHLDSLRRFKEMPPAYRAEFPPLTVDVHVYNADANRSFVIVGGKRYRAGDTLAEGPHIDEIVSEGIVFEWRNEKILYALGR